MVWIEKIKNFFKLLYDKLVKIDDSPQRIALGFGLGVFCGILPGTGPLASVAIAFIFRVNKIAALTASLLTNTWLSVVTFLAAVKIGSAVSGVDWRDVYNTGKGIIQNFHWKDVSSIPFAKILLPLGIGYFLVGLASGGVGYLIAIFLLNQRRKTSS